MGWAEWVIALIALSSCLGAMALVVLTLPGIWCMFVVSGLCMLWRPDIISWRVVVTIAIIGIIAEAVEFFASALGSKRMGGSKRGAMGSIVGTIIGAILGGIFLSVIPIVGWVLGPIIGGILGAGAGALLVERGVVQMSWKDSAKSGGGAAIGRTVSIFVKLGLAVGAGMFFVIAAFV